MIITGYRSIKRTQNVPLYSDKAERNNVQNFCANLKADKLEPLVSKSLEKLGDFSVENYKKLSEAEKIRLREEYVKISQESDFYGNCEEIHETVSEALKDKFNKKYGKGKYVVITVGRSLSSIGKVLGYKIGEENVKNIPMSNAKSYLSDRYVARIEECGHIAALNKYLKSVGLDRESVKKSKKTFVIIDYCRTGDSLKGAKKLLTRDDVLGNSKKIKSYDVIKSVPDENARIRLEGYLYSELFKNYSFVEKCNYFDIIESRVVNPQNKEDKIKLMWFKLLDNYMQKSQEKKTNPIITFFQNVFK